MMISTIMDGLKGDVMMITTVMVNFQHLTQDCPNAEGHLLVALPGQPLDRFEVTEVIRQGTSLVLQCQPVEKGNDSEPRSPRDDSDHVFITDDDAQPLSRHDPRRFYEDLR